MAVILGIFLCVVAAFLLYKRLKMIVFGKSAVGEIIGYANPTHGTHGRKAYPYKIKYEYDNQEYIACSIENTTVSGKNIPNKNLNRQVTVCFMADNPNVVTIKDFSSTDIMCLSLFLLGIFAMLI